MAVNTYKNRGTEQETTFFNVTLWGGHAENLMNRCRKGDQVYIQGGYSFREYTRAEGGKGYSHDVNARDVHYFTEPGPSRASNEAAQDSDPTWEESLADETSRDDTPADETSREGAPVEEMPEAGDPSGNRAAEAEDPSGNRETEPPSGKRWSGSGRPLRPGELKPSGRPLRQKPGSRLPENCAAPR